VSEWAAEDWAADHAEMLVASKDQVLVSEWVAKNCKRWDRE